MIISSQPCFPRMKITELADLESLSDDEIKLRWEAAYLRFETPEEERRKFNERLDRLGVSAWSRDSEIVEIFCGRGNGLNALQELGFTRLSGVDLSPELIAQYTGPAEMFVADCRKLPFADNSRDGVIVQGGLHHLLEIPGDLEQVLSEVCRVLRTDGKFVMVEPWLTPFLSAAHHASKVKFFKAVYPKLDALAAMIHYEAPTYTRWLESKDEILQLLADKFTSLHLKQGSGKLSFVGSPK